MFFFLRLFTNIKRDYKKFRQSKLKIFLESGALLFFQVLILLHNQCFTLPSCLLLFALKVYYLFCVFEFTYVRWLNISAKVGLILSLKVFIGLCLIIYDCLFKTTTLALYAYAKNLHEVYLLNFLLLYKDCF